MSSERNYLGNFEEIVLLATFRLGADAYGARIRQTIEGAMEKSVSIGAVYATLDRLERKGFVISWQGEPTAERGGRAKRYFKVEGLGMEALHETQMARHRLVKGLDLGDASVGGVA
jgi:DNA-binding PadR family transcriptional regulator